MREREVLRLVELPLAVPAIAAGIRSAAVQIVATATLGAIFGSGGLGRFLVEGIAQNSELMRVLLWESRAQPDLAARAARFPPQARAWLARYLEHAAARYGWPARDWYTGAQAFLGMIWSYVMTRTLLVPDPRLAPPEEAVPLFVRIFLVGLTGAENSWQAAESIDRGA